MIHSIEAKHKLYKNWKRSIVSGHPEGSIEMREKYQNYNKSLKKLIKTAKYSYYSKKFVNCNGNMKKTWQIINEIRGKSIRNIKPLFKYKDDIITDEKEIANKFNEYCYVFVGSSQLNSLLGISRHYKSQIQDHYTTSTSFKYLIKIH